MIEQLNEFDQDTRDLFATLDPMQRAILSRLLRRIEDHFERDYDALRTWHREQLEMEDMARALEEPMREPATNLARRALEIAGRCRLVSLPAGRDAPPTDWEQLRQRGRRVSIGPEFGMPLRGVGEG